MLGAPPGYVGYDEGGQLTEAVRRRPYSVILFDEIEKAHPDVFNVLLQILDDGRLTDGQGRTIDFRNTVVIMTSNLGSQAIQEMAGQDFEKVRNAVIAVLREHFRPEFLNRIDEVIVFKPLTEDQLTAIVDIQLRRLESRLAERRVHLEVTEAARKLLAQRGWDPVYGARPLKRAIQRLLQDPLAMMLLEGKFTEGDTITVDAKGGEITFTKATSPAPVAAAS
jgi:ATP-dependent Clp protease ATP-binding subunit ClpB